MSFVIYGQSIKHIDLRTDHCDCSSGHRSGFIGAKSLLRRLHAPSSSAKSSSLFITPIYSENAYIAKAYKRRENKQKAGEAILQAMDSENYLNCTVHLGVRDMMYYYYRKTAVWK